MKSLLIGLMTVFSLSIFATEDAEYVAIQSLKDFTITVANNANAVMITRDFEELAKQLSETANEETINILFDDNTPLQSLPT